LKAGDRTAALVSLALKTFLLVAAGGGARFLRRGKTISCAVAATCVALAGRQEPALHTFVVNGV